MAAWLASDVVMRFSSTSGCSVLRNTSSSQARDTEHWEEQAGGESGIGVEPMNKNIISLCLWVRPGRYCSRLRYGEAKQGGKRLSQQLATAQHFRFCPRARSKDVGRGRRGAAVIAPPSRDPYPTNSLAGPFSFGSIEELKTESLKSLKALLHLKHAVSVVSQLSGRLICVVSNCSGHAEALHPLLA